MKRKNWFLLKPHVYVIDKPSGMLLYDTFSGKCLQIRDKGAISMIHDIYEDVNLGSIEITSDTLESHSIKSFLSEVEELGMGKLVVSENKPLVLLPILSLNLDMDRLLQKGNADFMLARDISKNLLELTIMLNDSCGQNCVQCKGYNRQFLCCGKQDFQQSLPRDILLELQRQLMPCPSCNINIIGGDIYRYDSLELLRNMGLGGMRDINVYVHYLNYQENPYIDNHHLHIMVNCPIDETRLGEVISLVRDKEVHYHLIVEGEVQYEEMKDALTRLGVEDFDVHPFYNGGNMDFFEENVFLTEEDILGHPISLREIFRNQKLNANSFGSLCVLPNGDVKANLNERVVGNLQKDRLMDIIYREMMENTSWRKVRSGKPCDGCIYQYLCPPPSNYEKVMGTNNLCHIIQ